MIIPFILLDTTQRDKGTYIRLIVRSALIGIVLEKQFFVQFPTASLECFPVLENP